MPMPPVLSPLQQVEAAFRATPPRIDDAVRTLVDTAKLNVGGGDADSRLLDGLKALSIVDGSAAESIRKLCERAADGLGPTQAESLRAFARALAPSAGQASTSDASAGINPTPGPSIVASFLRDLSRAPDLLKALDAEASEFVRSLLPPHAQAALDSLAAQVRAHGRGRVVLDSDGTNYMHIDTGSNETTTAYYALLEAQGRVLPGRAIAGEVAQEHMYAYRVTPDMVEVWRRLAEHNVEAGIFSGRKEGDLRTIYAAALDSVPGFALYPSKGRAIVTHEGTSMSPLLSERLSTDPLLAVSKEMTRIILAMPHVPATLDHSTGQPSGGEFERLTGYRVSPQEVDGRTVLLRLHHRYRACAVALEAGAPIANLDDPKKVDGAALSAWLQSSEPGAPGALKILQDEDRQIQAAWSNAIDRALLEQLQLSTKDHVGHRSMSQDHAPDLQYIEVLQGIERATGNPVLLYAGDNYGSAGNDRPVMDALRAHRPEAIVAAVTHGADSPESADWMCRVDQFQLFLAQYALSRMLREA